MGMPQEVISSLSSLHGMYLEGSGSSLRGFGIDLLEDDVVRERVARLECSHIGMNVDIREKRYERVVGILEMAG